MSDVTSFVSFMKESPGDVSTFTGWLENRLNNVAESCSSYVRSNDESPPDKLAYEYRVLVRAWDGYQIIVKHDVRYQSQEVSGFVESVKSLRDSHYRPLTDEHVYQLFLNYLDVAYDSVVSRKVVSMFRKDKAKRTMVIN